MSTQVWKKCENERGFIYYVNNKNHTKQWDHQQYAEIKLRLDECNYILFPCYRLAFKFRALQNSLYLDEVTLATIRGVFERHKFGANENSLLLEACDLEAVLSDVYFATNKQQHLNINVDTATDLMLNFIYNVFDADRRKHVEVISCKLTLALLSNCDLNDLFRFIFSLVCDHNNCVTRLRLQAILSRIITITLYLNESASLSIVDSAIEHCFKSAPGLVGIDERAFYAWLDNTPSMFAWLPILHRIRISQLVLHKAKCCVCNLSPIVGMKYKCMKCSGYVQCQQCFLYGRVSHPHKTSHVMKEHCRDSNGKQLRQRFASRLCKLLKCKYRVCDAIRDDMTIMANWPVAANLLNKPTANEIGAKPEENQIHREPLSPMLQLQVIIQQLERQSTELQQALSSNGKSTSLKKCVEDHAMFVARQVQKLKVLKTCMSLHMKTPSTVSLPKADAIPPSAAMLQAQVQSTPMIPSTFRTLPKALPALDTLSPISQKPRHLRSNHLPDTLSKSSKSVTNDVMTNDFDLSSTVYTMNDISTWLAGPVDATTYQKQLCNQHEDNAQLLQHPTQEQSDLDDALTKLQQILTNNFSLDDNINTMDNRQLKSAVNEVEDVLSSIIDSAELRNSALPFNAAEEVPGTSCYSSVLSTDYKLRANYSDVSKYWNAEGQI